MRAWWPRRARATAAAQLVITSLSNAAAVEEVVFGAEGVAGAAAADKLLVDMSSIDPARTAEMAARLHAGTGMGWVDAPLSGGAPAAAKGALTLMLGGTEADVARARPLLEQLAARATHLGAAGAGQTVKLVNQVLCACGFLAVAEAVRFAEAAGVDATKIPAALAGGRADSRILQEFMAKMARRDYSVTGRIANMLKDLESVQAARARRTRAHARDLADHRPASHAGRRGPRRRRQRGVHAALRSRSRSLVTLLRMVVMGPSSTGKSTLGTALAASLNAHFMEGDNLHPPENLAKMRAGIALDDVDRRPFLNAVVARPREHRRARPGHHVLGAQAPLSRLHPLAGCATR